MVNKTRKTKSVTNHAFKNLRDCFLVPGPGATPSTNPFVASTGAGGGTGNTAFVLAPLGLTSATMGTNVYNKGTNGNVAGPCLRGLFNKAVDFQWYRVTRARFIFVGSVTSTTTGTVTLVAYSDPCDVAVVSNTAYTSTASTKTFDLANASSKELSIPIPVDSSWKKCSSLMSVPGDVYPFNAAGPNSLATINTVGDLAFGACSAQWTSTTGNIEIGRFYIDYDIEFKGPIDFAVNV